MSEYQPSITYERIARQNREAYLLAIEQKVRDFGTMRFLPLSDVKEMFRSSFGKKGINVDKVDPEFWLHMRRANIRPEDELLDPDINEMVKTLFDEAARQALPITNMILTIYLLLEKKSDSPA